MSVFNLRNFIYKPFNLLYLGFLVFLGLTLAGWFLSFFRGLLVESIGIPQEFFWAVLFLSLIGSYINFPLFTLESVEPIPFFDKVESFGVVYEIPRLVFRVERPE